MRRGQIKTDRAAGDPAPVDGRVSDVQHPGTTAHTTAAVAALAPPGMTIADALGGVVPDAPGLYALHGGPGVWAQLGLERPGDTRPLYAGKAEASLVQRDLRTHFATGRTGQSSPRRSFAALLADRLALVPVPRRPTNPEPDKWTHYALEADGDERLTQWMHEHLRIAVWPSDGTVLLKDVERAVMDHWKPPLNLTGVAQHYRHQVRSARRLMADRARAWARERGLTS